MFKKKREKVNWRSADDIKKEISFLVEKLQMDYINPDKIICFRSFHSSARARARIWSFPKIWQLALNLSPYYVVEVLSEHFDHLSYEEKQKILIHELLHIPKNFSGSLLSHNHNGRRINKISIERLFRQLRI